MEYRLGICDEDYHYIVNLMEYTNTKRLGGVSLVAFSSLSAVSEYLSKNYLDGVVLGVGLNVSEDTLMDKEGLLLIPLSEDRDCKAEEIYKYQSADLIIKSLLERLNVSVSLEPISGKCFCGVYSPVGRCGKTILAKGLGAYHGGSIYISLEEYGCRDSFGEEILYNIIFENPRIHSMLEQLKPNEFGLKEVKGILSYMDIRQLDKSHIGWLKEQLLMGGDYERVIFDIGVGSLSNLNILDEMDRIYVPVLEDEEALTKLQAFKELLRQREYAGIGRKIQYVTVPYCHYASDMMKDFISKGEL